MCNLENFETITKEEFHNQEDGYEYILSWEGGNPDLFKMMEYCRSKTIVPNVTVNGYGITPEIVENLVRLCGAVSVSNYGKNSCYGTVKKLTDAGLKQVNIHQLLSEETTDQIFELIEDYQNDERLKNLNAIVFLSLKKRGRGEGYHRISDENFKKIVDICLSKNISFGFDSCTSCKFTDAIKDHPEFDRIIKMIEPCESTLFSAYLNVESKFYPCSFGENGEGIDVANCENFLTDVWYNPKTIEFRNDLIANNRNCPLYEI